MPDLVTPEAARESSEKRGHRRLSARFLIRRREGTRRGQPRLSGEGPQPPFEPGRPYPSCAPELASSWLASHANFVHVALASLFGQESAPERHGISAQDRAFCSERMPALMDAYERAHGRIRASYFARNAFAAAALTESDELDIVWGTQESLRNDRYVELLLRCQQLSYTGRHRLSANDRRHCQNLVFAVVVEIVRRMDRADEPDEALNAQSGQPDPPADEDLADDRGLGRLSRELDDAEDFMLRSAGRRAQIRYVKGMLAGVPPTLLAAAGAAALMQVLGVSDATTTEVALVAVAGALGAVVSVLLRMTIGQFSMNLPTLDSDMHNTDLQLIGMLRPFVGAVCGLAAYTFVQSALVPVDTQGDEPAVFLFTAIGFLAGFSERFFQDMFVRSGQGLTGAGGDAPTSGPAAGLSPPPGRAKARSGFGPT